MGKATCHWRTKKVDGGFLYVVSKFTFTSDVQPSGQYGITEILKVSGTFKTRARAKSAGIKARRYYQQIQADEERGGERA